MSDPATEAALREFARSIGALQSTVQGLVDTWRQQEASASQGRRDLHQKFDTVRHEVSQMTATVAAAVKDIAEIKPSVQAFKDAKLEAKGAQRLGKFIWGGLSFGGGLLGWMLANWVNIGGKPPHLP